jgi:hypothetical protein
VRAKFTLALYSDPNTPSPTKFVQGVFFSPLANHDRLIVGFDATARAKFTLALYSDPNTHPLRFEHYDGYPKTGSGD